MDFEKNIDESNDKFVHPLEEKGAFEEITQLKIFFEENKVAINTLKHQLIENKKA